jgi:transposase
MYLSSMRDIELYRHLLGLTSPWTVSRVELNLKEQRVDVFAEHNTPKSWPCAECGTACGLHDHEPERTWRHLDSCQFRTYLHARVPRTKCPEHGVRQVRVPWAEPLARFTLLFERLAIDVLLETDISGGARLLGLSWDEAQHIMERAVARGLARRPKKAPRYMGVDEKAIAKGAVFATVVNDVEQGHVIEVAEGRKEKSLISAIGAFTPVQLAQVEAVAMDMWAPYAQVIKAVLPGGADKIVFDRYHIMSHMNKAVDQVRRIENRSLRQEGDDRLVKTRYMWLYGEEKLPTRYQVAFEALRDSTLKTARAWAIKESLRQLWSCPDTQAGVAWWKRWYFWATHSRLEPVRKVATMLKSHLDNVLTYFVHPITNAVSEALNSTLQMLKHRARGYRSFANFRTAVLFHCGGLNLYPTVSHPFAR